MLRPSNKRRKNLTSGIRNFGHGTLISSNVFNKCACLEYYSHAVICTGKLTNQNWEYYKVNDNIRCLFLIASTHTEKTELAINVNDPNAEFSPKRESEEQGMTRLITCCISQSMQVQILKYLKLKWTLPLLRLYISI